MGAHMLKRNPREVTWTVLYRRKHKKGLEEETAKKRNKRTQKFQRAVLVQPFRILWPSVIRSQKYVRPRENKLLELPKSKRRQPLRSQHLRTTRHRKLSRRQLRMLPSQPQGLEESVDCNHGYLKLFVETYFE